MFFFSKSPRELKAAERAEVRVRCPAWHRVISASDAARDNNRTWEPISIITRKENGPVSVRLPDGSRTGRGCLARSQGAVFLSLSNGTRGVIAQSRARHRPVRRRWSLCSALNASRLFDEYEFGERYVSYDRCRAGRILLNSYNTLLKVIYICDFSRFSLIFVVIFWIFRTLQHKRHYIKIIQKFR